MRGTQLYHPKVQRVGPTGPPRNVVPSEIEHMPCTGGLVPGDRVAAMRKLLVVSKGTGEAAPGAKGCHGFMMINGYTRAS